MQAWRQGVAWSTAIAFAVLIVNLVLTIWSSVKFGTQDGVGIAHNGSCSVVNAWSTALKLLINILSSVLLSLSNYTMQCLVSPTRSDLDAAHARGDWMDIGVPSFRNLFRIRKSRTILWILLALSSTPVHLFYNSAIFKTLSANEYDVVAVSSSFLNGSAFDSQYWLSDPRYGRKTNLSATERTAVEQIQQHYLTDPAKFRNLTATDCINTYGSYTLAGQSNVIIVLDVPIPSNSSLLYADVVDYADRSQLPYAWICHDLGNNITGANPVVCDTSNAAKHVGSWTIDGQKVQYCLSRDAPSNCELQFSLPMLIAVIACNAIKCVAMFLAVFTVFSHDDAIIVTLGDAVATYMSRPDNLTDERHVTSMADIRNSKMEWTAIPQSPKIASNHFRRWFAAASLRRWCSTLAFFTACLAVIGVFLGIGVTGHGRLTGDAGSAWSIGFGEANLSAVIPTSLPRGGSLGLISAVLISNLPQLVMSFIYLTYNGLYTCMLLAAEWNSYSLKRQVLRVSNPEGQQKATRWLSLPYRYSLPLMFSSTAMHYLLSNGIYLVRIVIYKGDMAVRGENTSKLGYSPIAMVSVIGLGFVMLVTAIGVGSKRLKGVMPIAGSCSVAIAAACHPPPGEYDGALLPVMWVDCNEGKEKAEPRYSFTSQVLE